jgi:DNA repair exonuclease SbcCD ATPase subunit
MHSGYRIQKSNWSVLQCDKRIESAQKDAEEKIDAANKEAMEKVNIAETVMKTGIAKAEQEKNESIRQTDADYQEKIKAELQKLNDAYDSKVAVLNKKEDKLNEEEKMIAETKAKLASDENKIKSNRKQIDEQIQKNKELETALKEQQAEAETAEAAADKKEKEFIERLNQAGVNLAAFDNFVKNKDTIKNGYWYWRGVNDKQEPILGAAKIIGFSDRRVHLEDTDKQKFSVWISSLTKEQQALIELLKRDKWQ